MPIKLERNKADKVYLGHRLAFFYIQSSNACDPKSYFSKNAIFLQENVAWLCAFPLKDCNIYLKRVQWWSEKNQNKLIRIQFHRNMAPSANRFQHHFKIKIHLYIYIFIYLFIDVFIYIYALCFLWSCRSLKWMFIIITIWNMFLQESASSLWKGCKIPSNRKTSFQIST